MSRRIRVMVALAGAFGLTSSVIAQSTGGASRGGATSGGVTTLTPQSTSNVGSTSTSGSGTSGAGGSMSFGGNSGTGMSTGARPTGTTGQGGAGGGVTGPQFATFGQGAAAGAPSGFIGAGNRNGFAGLQGAGAQTLSAGGIPQFRSFGGFGGFTQQQPPAKARGSQMRIPQAIAFQVEPLPAASVQANLQTQFASFQTDFPGITTQIDAAGVVTLSGVAADAHASQLAAAMAMLEPGVTKVNNQLVVPSQTPAAPATAAPTLP